MQPESMDHRHPLEGEGCPQGSSENRRLWSSRRCSGYDESAAEQTFTAAPGMRGLATGAVKWGQQHGTGTGEPPHRSDTTIWGLGIEKWLLQGTLCSTQRWDIEKRAMRGHAGRETRLVQAGAPEEELWTAWGLLDMQRCQR